MAHVIDLTLDSSPPAAEKKPRQPPKNPWRAPPHSIKNNARAASRPELKPGLAEAIDTATAARLREILKLICRENEVAEELAEKEMLVVSEKVVPYHADSASEEASASEEESEEESDDDGSPSPTSRVVDTAVPKGSEWPVCEHCHEIFDPADNEKNECLYHPDPTKYVDVDADIWTDHDDYHGDKESLEDDLEYASGFKLKCCGSTIGGAGCMETNHKGPIKSVAAGGKKREAASSILRPRFAGCENCREEFDVTSNERGDCIWHPGDKEFDSDSYIWDDMDEKWEVQEDYIDNPRFADGYVWTCCDAEGSAEGCRKTKHKSQGLPRKKAKY